MNPQGKDGIGWCDFTINPVDGLCKHACWYCYEAKRRKRFKLPEDITFRANWFDAKDIKQAGDFSKKHGRGARIFVGSTHDLFGEWIPDSWIKKIINVAETHWYHTFLFLTKNPWRYYRFQMPDNCWRGVTITQGKAKVFPLADAGIRFASFEPLMGRIEMVEAPFDWVIAGAMTKHPGHEPKEQWVDSIIYQAEMRDIPVFLKDNIRDTCRGLVRKEFPK